MFRRCRSPSTRRWHRCCQHDAVRSTVGTDASERQPARADGGVGHVQRRAGRRRDGIDDGRVVLRRRHGAAAGGGEGRDWLVVLSDRPPVKLIVDPVLAFRNMPCPVSVIAPVKVTVPPVRF